jgi:hypothetical protein
MACLLILLSVFYRTFAEYYKTIALAEISLIQNFSPDYRRHFIFISLTQELMGIENFKTHCDQICYNFDNFEEISWGWQTSHLILKPTFVICNITGQRIPTNVP